MQRCSSLEQGYNELHAKYNEVLNSKVSLEKTVLSLQSTLDEETSAKSRDFDHISELESEY